MQIGIGISLTGGTQGHWTPAALGSSLLGWWDAEQASTLTLNASAVTTWTDSKGGLATTQGTAGFKPAYSATGFNTTHPGVTPDGTDDYLNIESQPFPGICEVWAVVDQAALVADTTTRVIISFGGTLSASRIQLQRDGTGGINRVNGLIGNGAGGVVIPNGADFFGKTVVRLISDGVNGTLEVNGVAGTPTAAVASIGTTRVRLFAANSTTPANFWGSPVNTIAVTGLLSASQSAAMYAYLNARKA